MRNNPDILLSREQGLCQEPTFILSDHLSSYFTKGYVNGRHFGRIRHVYKNVDIRTCIYNYVDSDMIQMYLGWMLYFSIL
jgi:hypothetical protein